MGNRMTFAGKVLGSTAMLLAVAACGGGTQYGGGPMSAQGDIRAAQESSASSPFAENLRKGYLELATNGARGADWIDSGIFARKARLVARSEERRVGNECVSTCSSRWSPSH